MIGIVDYGAGNLLSVKKALDHLNVESKIMDSSEEFRGADGIVLPGVGAFGAAMQKLRPHGLCEFICEWALSGKPLLGICLGMQLLFEKSEESEGEAGFGILSGDVLRFRNCKVPQIGWNRVKIARDSPLWGGIDDMSFFYFLHGYYPRVREEGIVAGTTEYGIVYPSVIERGNICAVQFHPEKSGEVGLRMLENWVRRC